MKIRKFTCRQCGAPKINPYRLPYIVCDFCGSFTDIDFAVGMDAWNTDPNRTQKYQEKKGHVESKLKKLLGKGDRANYERVQFEYWDLYYKIFPEYLPPSVSTDERYKKYLEICAHSSTEYAFDPSWAKKAGEQALLQKGIQYHNRDGKTCVETDSFFRLADFYIQYTKDSFAVFYDNPDYAIMNELLPPELHLKMKLSMFVQAWLPYLTKKDQERLLAQLHFTNEYVEAPQLGSHERACEFCQKPVAVPEGSYKVYCESCLKVNTVQKTFNCVSCGSENEVPENPARPVNCNHCSTENRLIKGWF